MSSATSGPQPHLSPSFNTHPQVSTFSSPLTTSSVSTPLVSTFTEPVLSPTIFPSFPNFTRPYTPSLRQRLSPSPSFSPLSPFPSQPVFHSPTTPFTIAPHFVFPTHTSPLPTPNFSHGSLRPLKLDLERFSGDDSYGWLASVECFLTYYGVLDEDKVTVAAVHLSGDASLWMQWFEQRFPKYWTLFTTSLLQHFGSTDICDFEASLSHIQQTGSLAYYLTLFTKLACRAPEWSDTQFKGVFIGGLQEELHFDVQALQPNNLSEARHLSQIFNSKL
ncbi:unnamed protein product [Prunus armeniaca]|uniref:Retrotransposon gag domain-containing protein n=1 Tax=Prunus armeniaca TaxID=36596 RepID=A0A6J5X4Z5_PRUAR|nr:unnamed protein product [Prunus armeniaca]